MTPEGKIKAKLKRKLQAFPRIYQFWPVPSGFGKQTLDVLLCIPRRIGVGVFVAVETKKPGGDMTPRQKQTGCEIARAGGVVFLVNDDETLQKLITFIDESYER